MEELNRKDVPAVSKCQPEPNEERGSAKISNYRLVKTIG